MPEKILNNHEEISDIVNTRIMPNEKFKDLFLVMLCNELTHIAFPELIQAMARSLFAQIEGPSLGNKNQKTIETARSWETRHIENFKKCKDYEAIQKYCQKHGLALEKVNLNKIIMSVFDSNEGSVDGMKVQ